MMDRVYFFLIKWKYMISTISKNKINFKELTNLYRLSAEFTEAMEFLFEKNNNYKSEFVRGLKKSISEARSGNLHKIKSLSDRSI